MNVVQSFWTPSPAKLVDIALNTAVLPLGGCVERLVFSIVRSSAGIVKIALASPVVGPSGFSVVKGIFKAKNSAGSSGNSRSSTVCRLAVLKVAVAFEAATSA